MEGSDTKDQTADTISCAGCLNNITDDDYVAALGQDWHKDCFRCSVCDSQLSAWYFEKGGLLFCQDDYWATYGENCHQCAQVITGPVMAAGAHRFHPECFACASCGLHIGAAEPYALLERSHLYCGACYARAQTAGVCGGEGGGGAGRRARGHAIRSVAVPAAGLRLAAEGGELKVASGGCARAAVLLRAALALCLQAACHMYRAEGVCALSLRAGERVLEVNGAPTRGRALADVTRALAAAAAADTLVQLTVEHDPETTETINNNNNNIPTNNTQTDNETEKCTDTPNGRIAVKESVPETHSIDETEIRRGEGEDSGGRKERLFKRKSDSGGKGRVIKRRQAPASPQLADKERSSSMSKLLDVSCEESDGGEAGAGCAGCAGAGPEAGSLARDLARARSFRAAPAHPDHPHCSAAHRVFRANDLLQGELLGAGFFGQVYKVTHRDTGEVMVLKQLYRLDEHAQNNFLKEVAVLRSLRHRNVLRFEGVLYKERRLHLVTEYVPGGTLHQLLQDKAVPLAWAVRARLARDVAAGVRYLHRTGVIHRDLNSHNCLVREDKTVVVADFGLARIVQRAGAGAGAGPHGTLRRKRYTVVGNPYWMAPEMMNGDSYDERVDVFSFGIILCEIIGRVPADPDYLPRRNDFGLNEPAFLEQFCEHAPPPLYALAFRACQLEPERRPTFECMESWLCRLVALLEGGAGEAGGLGGAAGAALLADVRREAGACACAHCAPARAAPAPPATAPPAPLAAPAHTAGVLKSESVASLAACAAAGAGAGAVALGKCVSASHIGQRARVTVTDLSRSERALHAQPGYILRARPGNINITKVGDITKWLDPSPQLGRRTGGGGALPAFLRIQSVEGLGGREADTASPPRRAPAPAARSDDSDSSDSSGGGPPRARARPRGATDGLFAQSASYDVALRSPSAAAERRVPEVDCRRFNIDHLTRNPLMAAGVRNVAKIVKNSSAEEPASRGGLRKLLSPKLGRLFGAGKAARDEAKGDRTDSKSEFFVQRPAGAAAGSGAAARSSYRVRPAAGAGAGVARADERVIKTDLKLAGLGKPMTPIFRRHALTERPSFADGRFSCRERRGGRDGKPPGDRGEAGGKGAAKEAARDGGVRGISRSNYVSLANLRINSKAQLDRADQRQDTDLPTERVI